MGDPRQQLGEVGPRERTEVMPFAASFFLSGLRSLPGG